jgi:hypothetical protein
VRAPVNLSVGLLLLAAASGPARGDDVNCPPSLGNVTIDGNVLVAAACRLEGTIVIGNVHLYAGGSLISRAGTRIGGSIQAENADFVDLQETRVDGNIQLDDLVGERSLVVGSTVGGSIQINQGRSRFEIIDNTVGSDVQAFSNAGQVVIADNSIDGNLQCKSNSPVPAGGNNVVQGNKEDQCADLQPEGLQAPAPAPSPAAPASQQSQGGGGSLGFGSVPLLMLLALLGGVRRRVMCGTRG